MGQQTTQHLRKMLKALMSFVPDGPMGLLWFFIAVYPISGDVVVPRMMRFITEGERERRPP